MKFQYAIFPEQRLIVQRYIGDVTLRDLAACSEQMWANPLYCKTYDGVADITQISMKVTPKDLTALADKLIGHNQTSEGRWVALVSSPVVTALALLFQQAMFRKHQLEVFSTWEAAGAFLGIEDLASYQPE